MRRICWKTIVFSSPWRPLNLDEARISRNAKYGLRARIQGELQDAQWISFALIWSYKVYAEVIPEQCHIQYWSSLDY
jgi:hypothetical protein